MQVFSLVLGIIAIISLPVATWIEFGKSIISPRVASALVLFGALIIWEAYRMGPEWTIVPSYASVGVSVPIALLRYKTSRCERVTQASAVRYLTNLVPRVTHNEVSLYVSSQGHVGIGSYQLKPHNRYYLVTDACAYCTVEMVLGSLGVDTNEYGSYIRRGLSKQAVLRQRDGGYRLTYVDPKPGAVFFRPDCHKHAS